MALVPTTLQAIINQVRFRTNTEVNQVITDAELTGYINDSLSQLDMLLISKFDDYKLTNTILTVDASGRLALPADFLKLRGVDVQVNANDPDGYLPIRRFSFRTRNRKPYLLGTTTSFGPHILEYRLQGAFVQIEPILGANQWSYRLWYTPDFVRLVNPTDTLQPYMDSQAWYDYAVCDCAVKVLAKQDLDPSTFLAQKAENRELITKVSAPNRDAGEPPAVEDTRYWNSSGGGYGWGW